MPRLPVKKLRKQLKLLLLLALLTSAAWFTYLHISLVRQGRALRLPFAYGKGNGAGGCPRQRWERGLGGLRGSLVGGGSPPPLRGTEASGVSGSPGCGGALSRTVLSEHLGFGGPRGV